MISDASLPRCRECPTCANNDHNGVLVATTTKHSEKGWPHTQIRLLHILFVHYFVFYSRRCCLSRNVQQLFQRNAIPTNICTCSASVTSVLLIRVSLEIAFNSFIPFHLCGILHEMVQNVQKGCRMPHILSVCVCLLLKRRRTVQSMLQCDNAKYQQLRFCRWAAVAIHSTPQSLYSAAAECRPNWKAVCVNSSGNYCIELVVVCLAIQCNRLQTPQCIKYITYTMTDDSRQFINRNKPFAQKALLFFTYSAQWPLNNVMFSNGDFQVIITN